MSDTTRGIEAMFSGANAHQWTVEQEQEVIARAKGGDESATEALLGQYHKAMKTAISTYAKAVGNMNADGLADARQNAVMGILESIRAFDPAVHDRLGAVAFGYVADAVGIGGISEISGFRIPKRTLTRFFAALRDNGGNPYTAAAHIADYAMSSETFFTILSAVRGVMSYDAPSAESEESVLSRMDASSVYGLARSDTEIVEDDMLVRAAFRAVDAQEEQVIRHSYGFHDYEAQSDAEVAHRLGLSRPKVQRVRAGGLAKMRNALGVA